MSGHDCCDRSINTIYIVSPRQHMHSLTASVSTACLSVESPLPIVALHFDRKSDSRTS